MGRQVNFVVGQSSLDVVCNHVSLARHNDLPSIANHCKLPTVNNKNSHKDH